ncbi:alpha-glucosidase, partial [Pseudoxanthomonas sp. SGD-10]
IEDYRDIESINMHQYLKSSGGDLQHFLNVQKLTARDNGRTPFQWNDSENAGFTDGISWIKVNPDYKEVNAAAQQRDEDSVLNYFKNLIAMRKYHKTLVYGKYELLDALNEAVYTYRRRDWQGDFIIMLNFTANVASVNLDLDMAKYVPLISNYANPDIRKMELLPYQAVVAKLAH